MEESLKEDKIKKEKDIYLENENISKDPFLFIINIKKVDISFLCGCSLFCAIKLISIFMIINSISNIFFSFNSNYINIIFSLIYNILYFISGFYLFKSTISFDFNESMIGYNIFAFLFICELLFFIFSLFLSSIGIIHPFGNGKRFLKIFVIYLFGGLIFFLIKLYLVWITFSYYVHIKLNRIKVIMMLS
jgi:hypothetical protein